jgi:ribosomal protein S18 acetylase RimI-like enzyme
MLTSENIDMLVKFEQKARISEPDVFIEDFDADKFKEETLAALKNPVFIFFRCMLCNNEENQTIGRIDFTIVSSFSFGGNLQIYVDWIYVLKEFRRQGIAQLLFSQMESYIKNMGIFEYFLLTAENSEAQSFYHSIEGAEIQHSEILRKYLK